MLSGLTIASAKSNGTIEGNRHSDCANEVEQAPHQQINRIRLMPFEQHEDSQKEASESRSKEGYHEQRIDRRNAVILIDYIAAIP